MATEGLIILPDDAPNTGKQIRTHTRVVAGQTVHNHTNEIQDPNNDVQARVLTGDAAVTDGGIVTHPAPSTNNIGVVSFPAASLDTTGNLKVAGIYAQQQLALLQNEHALNYEDRYGFRSGFADGPRQGFRS